MIISCYLCDKKEELDSNSQLAKMYRNHPLKTYLCTSCNMRIKEKTLKRLIHLEQNDDLTPTQSCTDH